MSPFIFLFMFTSVILTHKFTFVNYLAQDYYFFIKNARKLLLSNVLKFYYFVPNKRSPASPSPGTM